MTRAKADCSGMVKNARKTRVQKIPATLTTIPTEYARSLTKRPTHATAPKTTSGAPKNCNASAPVRMIRANLIQTATNSAMTTMSKDSTAAALNLISGIQTAADARGTAPKIYALTKLTATGSATTMKPRVTPADASTDMSGFPRIHAGRTTALRIRAKILKIPTERALSHTLPTGADARKITHGTLQNLPAWMLTAG